jgi:hypothetical protein
MNTKLTLRLDDEVIRRAKDYAREVGKPVSRLVEDYFVAVTTVQPTAAELPPLVQSLRGVLAGTFEDEEDYRRHLEEKHR